ncbi:UPF0481 protein At3g47200-like [Ziziphus jujuba]|uniref:UPF0481 protein At3g47200-like n=1 Tax=Ziziphus jujuba TaxID=326968 RepID=A0ABM3IV59_ZIZJJ|nr:UPF0481 protein At3g47200-like [Ziziphus jujuba]
MASVYLRDKEKQKILTEAFLDKQSFIDIPEGSIKERGLASDQHNMQETRWIHRVPEKLRNVRQDAYTPQLVSIGPLHYGNPKLTELQDKKFKYEQEFWDRDFCKHIPKEKRMEFVEKNYWLENIHRKNAVTIERVDRSELKRMILQDACFIFELFLRNYEIQLHNKNMRSWTQEKLPEEVEKH